MKKQNILVDIPNHNHIEPADCFNKDEFIKLVKSRRSVRVFSDEPVNSSELLECLELGLLAPTSSNLQCWEFYWIKNRKKKNKLVQYCLDQPAARTAKELVVCVARTDTWKQNRIDILNHLKKKQYSRSAVRYYEKIVPMAYYQGWFGLFGKIKKIILSIVGIQTSIPREPTSYSDMRVWAHKTTALACENIMLALRAFGYDSCPMEGMDSKRIRKMLKLPRSAEICLVLGIGKRSENGIYGKRFRLDSNKFIKIVR